MCCLLAIFTQLPQYQTAHTLQGAVKGEGGLDDATGTNKFGGGASMKQTSAVVDLTKIQEKDDEEKVGRSSKCAARANVSFFAACVPLPLTAIAACVLPACRACGA